MCNWLGCTVSGVRCRGKEKREGPIKTSDSLCYFVSRWFAEHELFFCQVIVEKVPKSTIPDIDKKKFLVPADLSGA